MKVSGLSHVLGGLAVSSPLKEHAVRGIAANGMACMALGNLLHPPTQAVLVQRRFLLLKGGHEQTKICLGSRLSTPFCCPSQDAALQSTRSFVLVFG